MILSWLRQSRARIRKPHRRSPSGRRIRAPSIGRRFEKARALALLAKLGADAKSGVTADEVKTFADQAVAALADAIKAGWVELKEVKVPDFDAVRDREDLKKLVAELEAKAPKPAEVAPPPPEKK